MVGAWPAMETARLGDWVLRASRGFTQRANSVMTAGSPGIPVPAALDAVEAWYAARRLPANLTLAGPVGVDPADDAVGVEALRRGYVARVTTLTLTAPTRLIADLPPARRLPGSSEVGDPQEVGVSAVLTEEWLSAYRAYREVDDEAARAILAGSPGQAFATVRDDDGTVIGIGRLGLAAAWGGIAAMWVSPTARRRGVATAMLAALARAADRSGAASLHLQTDTDNTTALALYEGHGFERHHAYVNLRRAPR
jgi:ribosomal protein S18 acetylase RimI-like enzyme